MTQSAFLSRLAGTFAAGLLLAGLLWAGLGPQGFSFYGWAAVASATAVAVTVLLWRRLPQAGVSRWWSLLVGVPATAAAVVQMGFWFLFFRVGPENPTPGVAREMVRPWLDPAFPFLVAAWLVVAVWLLAKAGRAAGRG